MPVVDYELRLHLGDGKWKELKPFYRKLESVNLALSPEVTITLPLREIGLLYRLSTLVTRDTPMSGVVIFSGDESLKDAEISEVGVDLIDGFGTRHSIRTPFSELRNVSLINFLVPSMLESKEAFLCQ